ncbi:hypothetical protein [Paracoccus sp. ME4]|uniref:hypothetical protein n=1 Tax=Paracoccus sp. ME4 TaxID=3138066 RepID=UPI00398B5073
MRMFIPEIGTRIRLVADWTFPLIRERRNDTLFGPLAALIPDHIGRMEAELQQLYEAMRVDPPGMNYPDCHARRARMAQEARTHVRLDLVLPAGSELTIDRLYIRKGVSDHSSISFNLIRTAHPDLQIRGRKRFWAMLEDVNRIEFDLIAQ